MFKTFQTSPKFRNVSHVITNMFSKSSQPFTIAPSNNTPTSNASSRLTGTISEFSFTQPTIEGIHLTIITFFLNVFIA
jgi:hypothetical protein